MRVCSIIFLLIIACAGQPSTGLTPEQVKQDLEFYRSTLEKIHPGLYKFNDKSKFDELMKEQLNDTKGSYTTDDVFVKASLLMSLMKDGHSDVLFPESVQKKRVESSVSFPFGIMIENETIFLARNYGSKDQDRFLGSIVSSINGVSAQEIVERIFSLLPADGNISSGKRKAIEKPSVFSRFYWALYGTPENYSIVLTNKENKTQTITAKGMTHDQVQKVWKERYGDKELLRLKFYDLLSTAVLTIRTFDTTPENNLDAFTPKAFRDIEKSGVKNLILDIRDNGGGWDHCGRDVVAHLLSNTVDYYISIDAVRDNFDDIEDGPKLEANYFAPNSEGRFSVTSGHHPNLGKQSPQQPVFKGNVYVLINGNSFSTTSEVASMLRFHKRAIFIGEETGGRCTGNIAGYFPHITLPNSKVRVEVPVLEYRMAITTPMPDRGVIPDHKVIPDINSVLQRKDVELDFAMDLIKKQNSKPK